MANKYRLGQKFTVFTLSNEKQTKFSMSALELMRLVGDIHMNATKYPAFGWENTLTRATDSDTISNLEAIMRHSTQLALGNYHDDESGLPHAQHLLCRLQMLVTSTHALGEPYSADIREWFERTELKSFVSVSPSFIPFLGALDPKQIEILSASYVLSIPCIGEVSNMSELADTVMAPNVLNVRSAARYWLATLLDHLYRVYDNQEVGKPLMPESTLIEFGEELIAFSLSMLGRKI